MIKEYKIDTKKYNELRNTQYKKHPKWKKTELVRSVILIIGLIAPIAIEIYAIFKVGEKEIFSDYFFIALGVLWTFMITLVAYKRLLLIKCDDQLSFKLNESLILKDEYFENGYKPNGEGISTTYDIMQIRYSEIERLIFNKYHNRLRLYGQIRDTRYSNLEKRKKEYSFKDKSTIVFYMYYENSEEFLKTLSEKSGVKIEVSNKPEKIENIEC